MKTAATEAVVETAETAVQVVEKNPLLTPKTLLVAAGATLVIVGVVWGVKKYRERSAEEE